MSARLSRDSVPEPGSGMEISLSKAGLPTQVGLPTILLEAGPKAQKRFWEFFTANIRNRNTRRAYARAALQFLRWCDQRSLQLHELEPMLVASYIERLTREKAPATVKQSLAAIRMLFDFLVIGQVVPFNPASSVRGPKHVVKVGKTPVLTEDEARKLLDSIDTRHVVGLRDRALIGLMVYSFARVGAAVHMRVKDYYSQGRRAWFILHEKGGRFHRVPAHHKAAEYLDAYLASAGIAEDGKSPLFRSTRTKTRLLTERAMVENDGLRMVKRRAKAAGLPVEICNHSFRATGITSFLQNGGTIEVAAQIAGHESPRTTKLYDRRQEELSLEEIERVRI